MKAWQLIRTERLKDPESRPLLVILSDGEANVPYDPACPAGKVQAELLAIGGRIGRDRIASLVIDTRPLSSPAPEMRTLAETMGGTYEHISRLTAGGMVRAVVGFS
jgi:Mg-chelatase subunit ChlD